MSPLTLAKWLDGEGPRRPVGCADRTGDWLAQAYGTRIDPAFTGPALDAMKAT